MVDFRRMIPVLAVIAFLLGSAVTASAQNAPFQCFANGGVSTPARSEGITELVGDLVLSCTGGTPTAPGALIPPVNIQVFLNTALTSRLLTTATCPGAVNCFSEALLLLDEPQPNAQFACNPGTGSTVCVGYGNGLGTANAPSTFAYYGNSTTTVTTLSPYIAPGTSTTGQLLPGGGTAAACTVGTTVPAGTGCPGNNKNVFQAIQTTSNSVTFLGVPIDPPGTSGSRVIRITNVRGNANALGVAGANSTPTPIVETLSPNPPQFLPVSNPSQTVAFIQRGLTFGIFTNATGTTVATNTLQQCDNSRSVTTSTNFNKALGVLRYTENFATAFKQRFTTGTVATNGGAPGASGAAPQQNDLRTGTYNTESGFVNTALVLPSGAQSTAGTTAGLADWGTRLKAVFNNVPNGVSLFVDINSIPLPTTIPDKAVLTSGGEVGAFTTATPTSSAPFCTAALCGAANVASPAGSFQLTVTNGSAVAVWEVLQSDPNTFASLNFNFYATYTASPGTNSPSLATTTVNGSYAPTSTVTIASVANVPRFADTSTATNIFTIVPCLTTLLFPYVTSQAGFDTGIAISATATDPFATSPQSGTCTLNWFGAAFTGATPTPNVNSGTTYVTLVSTTLNNVTGGFGGYMIAVCRFQYAHGFAFISDLGARNLAMGYLALVIPDPSVATRLATPAVCGGGGQIAAPFTITGGAGGAGNGCVSSGENLGQ